MSQRSYMSKFTNVIGRISVDKLHLCEPGLRLRDSIMGHLMHDNLITFKKVLGV